MKVRISYSKTGPIRYVGHLDFMRTVQKIIKRSGIEGSYSKGFSPHYILSFASPLGVGAECKADYFDLELDYRDPFGDGKEDADLPEVPKGEEILGKLNASGIGGVRFNGIRRIAPGKASNAMAAVASASYDITFKDIEEGKKVTAALEGFLA